jgi:glycosyltransferase involved in cell wall biosynthesis
MRVGIVVQRYGVEVNGGAEFLCREHAEHLVRRPEVEALTVFTTCARDHQTWANHYQPGHDELNGVAIERFAVVAERAENAQIRLGNYVHKKVAGVRPLAFLEPAWFAAQGPLAPGLLRRLRQVRKDYDVFVFYTYLYFTTAFGLPLVAKKAVMVPTAHDEEPIRMGWFRWLFGLPRAFAFLTPEEQEFVTRTFHTDQPSDIVGTGIGTPDETLRGMPPLVEPPYVLYVGRVEPSKGFPALLDAFDRFKRDFSEQTYRTADGRAYCGRDLKLVLAGRVAWVDLPARDDVVTLGFVSDEQKSRLLWHMELFVMPSQYESLSIVLLESWAHEKPVLVNRACAATAGQVERSGGGATYEGAAEFAAALSEMLSRPEQMARSARSGKAYTDSQYAWGQVEDRMLRLLGEAIAAR